MAGVDVERQVCVAGIYIYIFLIRIRINCTLWTIDEDMIHQCDICLSVAVWKKHDIEGHFLCCRSMSIAATIYRCRAGIRWFLLCICDTWMYQRCDCGNG